MVGVVRVVLEEGRHQQTPPGAIANNCARPYRLFPRSQAATSGPSTLRDQTDHCVLVMHTIWWRCGCQKLTGMQ
jgi:hypothetical protein